MVLQATDSEPTQPVSHWFMFVYALTVMAIYFMVLTPLLATIAVKVGQLSAPDEVANNIGKLLWPGALAALLAAPIFGAISDRTKSRLGRRKLWIVIGCALAGAGLATMALATSLTAVGVGWFIVQIGTNATLSATLALLPDLVPENQRGRMSAMLGIGLSLGQLAGAYVSQYTTGNNLLMFLTPWALLPIAIILLFACFKDRPAGQMPPFTKMDLIRTFWVNPLKFPDFGWAFLSRFLVFLGVAYYLSYQFILIGARLKLNEADALEALALSLLITTVVTISCTLLSGWLSDTIGRRKPIVLAAGILVAIGLTILGTSTTLTQFLIGAAVYGIGQGVYFAVDIALVAAVLPDPDDTAKDLGVFNIASALPQTLAPAIAPIFLAIGSVQGGNLQAVFFAGAVFAVVGAFAVLPIKKTR